MPVSVGFCGNGFWLGQLEPSNLLFRYKMSCRVPGTPLFNPGCLLEFTWCGDVGVGVVWCWPLDKANLPGFKNFLHWRHRVATAEYRFDVFISSLQVPFDTKCFKIDLALPPDYF
jgi:hypothetical protein